MKEGNINTNDLLNSPAFQDYVSSVNHASPERRRSFEDTLREDSRRPSSNPRDGGRSSERKRKRPRDSFNLSPQKNSRIEPIPEEEDHKAQSKEGPKTHPMPPSSKFDESKVPKRKDDLKQ